jgi:hypothetical protein
MGLLDDAIREHLELKRRRGADPDEVARQEDEALGDPRSGEFARPDAPPADAEAAPQPAAPEEPGTEPEEAPEPPAAYAAPHDPEPAPGEPAPGEPEPGEPDEPWLEDERIEPVAGQRTAEFTPADAEPEPEVVRPDDEPAADEDVLEETPDFLQETPEHDRLWFEQKPPRDFDFDS